MFYDDIFVGRQLRVSEQSASAEGACMLSFALIPKPIADFSLHMREVLLTFTCSIF